MQVNSPSELDNLLKNSKHIVVLHIFDSNTSNKSQLNDIFQSLSKDYPKLGFYHISHELASQINVLENFSSVPIVLFCLGGFPLNAVPTHSPGSIVAQAREWAELVSPRDKLEQLLTDNKIIIFMKGTKANPFCKFSRRVVDIMNSLQVEYETFNILDDEIMRIYLKAYSNWPTYPQLYFNGELIGGHDIIVELYDSGELTNLLKN
ncbi:glutaredoxin-like protein, putative [Babesia microti strain RI]|uniref:Glutaredoxin-like protein, putative n=1 Tax=Babesia microti (strain RI) TaxID=1133968 RepID=A0A1R4ABM3_BABMR|nr:glutaredoxin-like protein, putative [Babesia microti strain RI]SJK86421.1 glutaredoxin-like protein, putative [Babesia microti strain RI]|eukprot:XP_021338581.1 glutaredoxin-like protein, putative [Babesia microti strain RI]